MSDQIPWDVERYREEHESDEQWELRKAFIERWKDDYDEDRLLCLARVFTNIEFMGCKYPLEVMKEVSRLSEEVAKSYRQTKVTKIQRTFVSASDAAEDRARGVKRKGGIVVDEPVAKIPNINFVQPGHEELNKIKNNEEIVISDSDGEDATEKREEIPPKVDLKCTGVDYMEEMAKLNCLRVDRFNPKMFYCGFGKMVLFVRPWMQKFANIAASCAMCGLTQSGVYDNGCYSMTINGHLISRATGGSKTEARSIVETMAWNRLREECVIVIVKEQWIPQGDKITTDDVSGSANGRNAEFGTPIENNVATRMMKLMGWSGGGLGADSQGIAEPIKPQLQMVRRAGLGSSISGIHQLRNASAAVMRRYHASDTLDLDLVFSNDFSKEERAELHQVAKKCGLISKSYGKDDDRFLVVRKKLDPFSLVQAVVDKGGNTPKYQVFIPESLKNKSR